MSTTCEKHYDEVDVAYLLKSFLAKFEESPEIEFTALSPEESDELSKMGHMANIAIESAESISEIIDFTESDMLGSWAYDHVSLYPGHDNLASRLWSQCVISTNQPCDVVRAYVRECGMVEK